MRSHVVYAPELRNRYVGEIPSIRKLRQWVSLYSALEQVSWLTVPHALNATDLLSIHSSEYIAEACDGRTGYTKELAIWALWSCATHLKAAEVALDERAIVCAPVSGFHHAGFDFGGSYCIFNGLMHTLYTLNKRIDRKALILDCDAHYGNGTDHIIEKAPKFWDFVDHVTDGDEHNLRVDFFDKLRDFTDRIRAGRYGIVLYQAGADAWISDPYQAGYLTKPQLMKRDREVFDACVASETPCVWNFAGGYAGSVTAGLHAETEHQATCAVVNQIFKEYVDGKHSGETGGAATQS